MMWGPKRKPPSVRTCREKHTKPQRTCQVPLRKDIKASFLGDLPCLLSRYFDQIVEVLQSLKAINDVTWCNTFFDMPLRCFHLLTTMSCISFWVFPVCVCVLGYTNHMLGMGWVAPSDSTLRALWGSSHLPDIGSFLRECCLHDAFLFSMSKKWWRCSVHGKWETRTCYVCGPGPHLPTSMPGFDTWPGLKYRHRHEWQPNIHGAFPMEDLQIIQNSTHFCIETYGFGDAPIVQ